jgi:HNH endonuclease
MGGKRGTVEERFWSKVEMLPDLPGCWLWSGYIDKLGRGWLMVKNGIPDYASRISWRIQHGEIPEDLEICHKCDTPQCVRPDHLFLGTHKDNMDDMIRKGRNHVGSKCVHAKLNESQVSEIRDLLRQGTLSQYKIATMYNVHRSTVMSIHNGKNWKQVS